MFNLWWFYYNTAISQRASTIFLIQNKTGKKEEDDDRNKDKGNRKNTETNGQNANPIWGIIALNVNGLNAPTN
jgi:hypothetical protein